MTEKEKLIYLLKNASAAFDSLEDAAVSKKEFIADFLIENGVIVPPCNVGDKDNISKQAQAALTERKKEIKN
ncbi:MAG: hypothetical protein IJ489_06950 [Clostridia bacterium]|nr:hypothetical protein [Clostridia bacterium]